MIADDAVIEQCVRHFAECAIINKSRQKWERCIEQNPSREGDWKTAKEGHRCELKAVRDAEGDVGTKRGTAFHTSKSRRDLEGEAKKENLTV